MAGKLPRPTAGACGKDSSQCGICLETLRQPTLLPCLHSFCRECLQTYIKSQAGQDTFPFPLCRETIATPDNMADGLEDDVYLSAEEIEVDTSKPPNCDLCEEEDASKTCIECKQHLCEHCTRTHSKLTSTREHHLVSLDQEQGGRRIQSKVYCNKHPSQELAFFCDDCQVVICFKCNLTTHKHHHSKDVEDIAAEKRREVLSIIEDAIEGKAVPDNRSYIDVLRQQRKQYETNNSEQRKLMEDHVQAIKQRMDKKMTDMISQLDSDLKSRVEILDTEIKSLESTLESNKESRHSARRMVDIAGDCEWLQRCEGIKTRLTEQLKSRRQLFETAEYKFSPGAMSEDAMEKLIGALNVTFGSTPPMKAEFVQTIKIEDGFYEAICAGSEETVWAGRKTQIKLYQKDGVVAETVEMGEEVYDITKDKSGQIFVACETSVKTVNKSGQSETCFRLPTKPSGLTCTPDGDIVVCFRYPGKVTQYSREGKVVKQFNTVREDGHQVQPYRAVFNVNQDLVVSDRASNDVTVFDVTGKVRAVIQGDEVQPRGLACSDHGHIYVADYNKNRVMIHSVAGQLLQTLVQSSDNGLCGPHGLSLDAAARNLWIGHIGKLNLYSISV